ncbi:MAG: hypothetical protein AAGI88_01245 [Pseudomonadota bacterium]
MTSGPSRLERTFATTFRALALAFATLLAACSTKEVAVSGNFPAPLLEPLPVALGVVYEPEFSGHEFYDEAKGRAESTWIVKTGEAQVEMWSQLLDGMFIQTVNIAPVEAEDPAEGDPDGEQPPAPEVVKFDTSFDEELDAILIPRVDELQYAIPAHTNVKVYEIWMRYAFELVSTNGDPIAEWTMTAYGKTPTAFLRSDEAAVNLAAVVALRDAGAHFITSFQKVPEVAQWLEDLENERSTTSAL